MRPHGASVACTEHQRGDAAMSGYPVGYIEQLARPLWVRRFAREERARRQRPSAGERAVASRVRAQRQMRPDAAAQAGPGAGADRAVPYTGQA